MNAAERSLENIGLDDLARLAQLAAGEEEALFTRRPAGAGRYRARLLCRALCQGAALHFIDRRTGVKDFDVWSFYAAHQAAPFPYRWRGTADFGPSRFGKHPHDPDSFAGRRVDLLGRSLDIPLTTDAATAIRTYLTSGTTKAPGIWPPRPWSSSIPLMDSARSFGRSTPPRHRGRHRMTAAASKIVVYEKEATLRSDAI